MKLSRRVFLAGCGIAALPVGHLRAVAAPVPPTLALGELWGMPYLAPGALGNHRA